MSQTLLALMPHLETAGLVLVALLQILFILRALYRPHRLPSARIAWIAVIGALPVIGILAYLMMGELDLGQARVRRIREAFRRLAPSGIHSETEELADPEAAFGMPHHLAPLFRVGQSASGYVPLAGNRARLLRDSDATIESMVVDIDAAQEHVHISFYIWLADNNGLKVVQALIRAAKRGVICRVMADDLGSRKLIRSDHWNTMKQAGVRLVRSLPIGRKILLPFHGRIDMRNHRKIVVIDSRITYCGSQNCADPEFRVKAKFAPWVDIMARFEGPVVMQNQHLFATDWMGHTDEDLLPLLEHMPHPDETGGFVAQVIGTGAVTRYAAMPDMFVALMYAATRELVISTPYYVPDESIQAALCSSARRGVATTLIFPARNDSRLVGASSRSYYRDLLSAGVRILEFPDGLLHSKTLTMDDGITLIGSANMDRRSFDLNFENNILLYDHEFTRSVRERQQSYIDASLEITAEDVDGWPKHRVILNNLLATAGPLL
ncbi:cardiolipin synthase [Acetobacter sp. AN02]|uniref:cardiolipin synthase n=1 Tax=Acetobacter sp. AN02 TaxID=2894186 RepID=UPI0024342DEF|nr:cardiolipin synthase [Acetobacter sp. AN02]MDG6094434.1 cardiolipin synthase [Acetobacter sp. AN02]